MKHLLGHSERLLFTVILALVGLAALGDIWNDYDQGSSMRHLLIETLIAVTSLGGSFFLWNNYRSAKKQVAALTHNLKIASDEIVLWKAESRKHVEGLSNVIDAQLTRWNLTTAEKEVALLLLKGMSHKEIATIRNTSEGSARQQALAVYQKSKLSGRSELSAFFLEDLLIPSQ